MHLEQCHVAFDKYLKEFPESSQILFVDYGCGPMTAGLALAEILSQSQIHYHGIDTSKNMVEMAQHINAEHQVFDNFKVVQADKLNPHLPAGEFDVAILSLSHILAPSTCNLREEDVKEMASIWHQAVLDWQCKETHIIYQNPDCDALHCLWDAFKVALQRAGKSGQDGEIEYTYTGLEDCDWRIDKPSKMERVTGKRNASV